MAQPSNRSRLIEGVLRCLERLPPERITARAIAAESNANLASIGYHFGSKDELVTAAVIEGLDRWLDAIGRDLDRLAAEEPEARLRRAAENVMATRAGRAGIAGSFATALARAQHDSRVRELLADGFRRSRGEVASVLSLGEDRAGVDAGALVLAMFHGLLLAALLDPRLAIEGRRMETALARLGTALPVG